MLDDGAGFYRQPISHYPPIAKRNYERKILRVLRFVCVVCLIVLFIMVGTTSLTPSLMLRNRATETEFLPKIWFL